jgi:hypothetical protein
MRAREFIIEDRQQLNEFLFLPLLIPLATAVRVAAPFVGRALWGATKLAGKVAKAAPKTTVATGIGGDVAYNDGDATKWVGKQAWDAAPFPEFKQRAEKGYKILTDPVGSAKDAAKGAVDSVEQSVKDVAAKSSSLIDDATAAASTAAKSSWETVEEAAKDISDMVGRNLTPEAIEQLSKIAVNYALPVAAVIAILYGGKMLYDYMNSSSKSQPQTA